MVFQGGGDDCSGQGREALGLGLGRRAVFWKLVRPMARPALAVGIALVLYEIHLRIPLLRFLFSGKFQQKTAKPQISAS